MPSRFKGLDKHMARLRALQGPGIAKAINDALVKVGKDIRDEADRSISAGSGAGKASAPGQAPNRQSGQLQDGLRVTNPKPGLVQVESTAKHAATQEFGDSDQAARPYLRPARDKVKRNLPKEARKAIRAKVKRR